MLHLLFELNIKSLSLGSQTVRILIWRSSKNGRLRPEEPPLFGQITSEQYSLHLQNQTIEQILDRVMLFMFFSVVCHRYFSRSAAFRLMTATWNDVD